MNTYFATPYFDYSDHLLWSYTILFLAYNDESAPPGVSYQFLSSNYNSKAILMPAHNDITVYCSALTIFDTARAELGLF
jgi:hypothetical protein